MNNTNPLVILIAFLIICAAIGAGYQVYHSANQNQNSPTPIPILSPTSSPTSGSIATGHISNGGTGYTVNDQLTVSGGNNDAILKVNSVNGGIITGVSIVNPGSGYSLNSTSNLSGGSGSNATYRVDTITFSPTAAAGPTIDPSKPAVKSQQQGTFNFAAAITSFPTIPPVLMKCEYGPGEANCISSVPRTCLGWNESQILAAFEPPTGDKILHVWYDDEFPLTLGVGNISPLTKSPDHISSLDTPPLNTGDPNGVDLVGRPARPALFISDLTSGENKDWEYGGSAYDPTEVFGTWKALGTSSSGIHGTWDLGPGSIPLPFEPQNEYVSEIRWDLSQLNYPFVTGHTYRLEFMIHDGDQTKGGDAGEKCANFVYQ
jgi:hypothetical protein